MKAITRIFLLCSLLSPLPTLAQGTSCVDVGGRAQAGAECCADLQLKNGFCQLPQTNFQTCAAPLAGAQLSATRCNEVGTACYPQREEDVFPDVADNSPLPESENDEGRHEDGDECSLNSDCESFICGLVDARNPAAGKECKEKLICRRAEVGEDLLPGAQCELGALAQNGECVEDNSDALPLGNLPTTLFTHQNQCSYKLSDEMVKRRISGMLGLRAFEVIFSNVGDDKMKVTSFLRDKVMKPFSGKHKEILKNFNIELNKIEADEKLVKEAKADSEKLVTIHGTEKLKEKELAARRASGKDALKLQWRRNLLSQSYERAMYAEVSSIASKLQQLSDEMGKWKGKHKKWTVPELGEVENGGKKIKKSFASKMRIKPRDHEDNKKALAAERVAAYLQIIGGDLPKKKFFLLDAPFPKNQSYSFNAGSASLPQTDSTAPIESQKIDGQKGGSLEKIRGQFKDQTIGFYRELVGNFNGPFSIEPELLELSLKNCFKDTKAAGCENTAGKEGQFYKFLSDVGDTAFAQFVAYSAHKKGKYKKFFEKENTLRRRMIKQLASDMRDMAKYYEELDKNRIAQDECLTKAHNYVVQDMTDNDSNNEVNQDTQGVNGGGSGSAGNQGSAGRSSTLNGGALKALPESQKLISNSKVDLIDADARKQFTPNLAGMNFAQMNKDNQGSGMNAADAGNANPASGGATLAESGAAAANAISRKKLEEENNKLRAKNPELAKKRDQQLDGAYASLAKSSGLAAGAGNGISGAGGLAGAESALKSSPMVMPADPKVTQQINDLTGSKDSDAAAGVNGASGMRGYSEGQNGNNAAGANEGTNAQGSKSALSDEDQSVMMANLERTRSQYEGQDSDELFEKVSKAYVRNLPKILTRKELD